MLSNRSLIYLYLYREMHKMMVKRTGKWIKHVWGIDMISRYKCSA